MIVEAVIQLVATFVGAGLGFWSALLVEHYRQGRESQTAKRALEGILFAAVDRDVVVLGKIVHDLHHRKAPTQRLYPDHYEASLGLRGIDPAAEGGLWGHTANAAGMIRDFNRTLDYLEELLFLDLQRRTMPGPREEPHRVQNLITAVVAEAIKLCPKVGRTLREIASLTKGVPELHPVSARVLQEVEAIPEA